MNSLFAPWRMEFIEKHDSKKSGCVLCQIGQATEWKPSLVIHKAEHLYVVLNKYPYSNGHLMVVPQRHVEKWTDLTLAEGQEMHELTQRSIQVLEKALRPQGFNLGVNLGRAAGAGIEDHVHQHVVPRWNGDFNFMPLLGETKVISEHLSATYDRIAEAWG